MKKTLNYKQLFLIVAFSCLGLATVLTFLNFAEMPNYQEGVFEYPHNPIIFPTIWFVVSISLSAFTLIVHHKSDRKSLLIKNCLFLIPLSYTLGFIVLCIVDSCLAHAGVEGVHFTDGLPSALAYIFVFSGEFIWGLSSDAWKIFFLPIFSTGFFFIISRKLFKTNHYVLLTILFFVVFSACMIFFSYLRAST